MEINLNKVREHVELYFQKHLPEYTVLEIRRKSLAGPENLKG